MEGGTGFEPVNGDFADHSVTTSPSAQMRSYARFIVSSFALYCKGYPPAGALVYGHYKSVTLSNAVDMHGAEDEIRTRDPRLGKAMLYR